MYVTHEGSVGEFRDLCEPQKGREYGPRQSGNVRVEETELGGSHANEDFGPPNPDSSRGRTQGPRTVPTSQHTHTYVRTRVHTWTPPSLTRLVLSPSVRPCYLYVRSVCERGTTHTGTWSRKRTSKAMCFESCRLTNFTRQDPYTKGPVRKGFVVINRTRKSLGEK